MADAWPFKSFARHIVGMDYDRWDLTNPILLLLLLLVLFTLVAVVVSYAAMRPKHDDYQ